MSEDRRILMTPERVERMLKIVSLVNIFNESNRQRVLVARVMARAVTDDDLFDMIVEAAFEPIPDPDSPEYQESVKGIDDYIHGLFHVRE
jgi:hypothetical protein